MKFGQLLRKVRSEKKKTLRDIARCVSHSVPYVSDVELGQRKPFQPEIINQIAEYLQIDPTPLLRAAVLERGAVTIQSPRPQMMEVAMGLTRNELSDEQLSQILEIMGRKVQ